MPHRIVLIGDPGWMRCGALSELAHSPRIHIAARLPLDADLVRFERIAADVGLVRIEPDVTRAMNLLKRLNQCGVHMRMIAVVDSVREELMRRCIQLNVWGCVFTSQDTSGYLRQVDRVVAGKLSYPPDILDRIVTHRGRMTLAKGTAPFTRRR